MKPTQQFVILFRQFLFRAVEVDMLSTHAFGDAHKLLGRFAALLLFLSIGLAVPAIRIGSGGSDAPAPGTRLLVAWAAEYLLISTTMFIAGLIGVLNWDAAFPDRRYVMVLSPYPVRPATLFLAKAAAGAAAVGLAVALLNALSGLAWPIALGAMGTASIRTPALGILPAEPAASPAALDHLLRRDLSVHLPPHLGVTIGVVSRGERRIFAFGTARPDSIYQIGSISKTFTGLLLAQLAVEGRVQLDEPVTPGRRRRGITLLELATHRSGLPPMPRNLHGPKSNPALGYSTADLQAFLDAHRRPLITSGSSRFVYSNAGFAVLGQALATRAGRSYEELLAERIAIPLGLADTAVILSPAQQARRIAGHQINGRPVETPELGALAPAGGICSTAADMLTYLEAQLAGSTPAIRLSHIPRAPVAQGAKIALGWAIDEGTGVYWHNGATTAYTSHALFSPKDNHAVVVLANETVSLVSAADHIAMHVRQRLLGEPAASLAQVTVPESGGLTAIARMFFSYWLTMTLAAAFVYGCLLLMQGVPALLLPRRLFLRVSSAAQLAALCILTAAYFLQPRGGGHSLIAATSWFPSFWFLGLLQQLSGSPALAPLAARAWWALGVVLALTAIVYALAYFRLLRRIAEEPDIAPGSRGGLPLPRFGGGFPTAVAQFSLRTLLRSRLHRMVLAFYLGAGLAFTVILFGTPGSSEAEHSNDPLLAGTIALTVCAIVGARVAFAFPIDLRANWIFRITGVRRAPECVRACRRALWLLGLGPALLFTATAGFVRWPWAQAAGHLAIVSLLGAGVVEGCLLSLRKLPFTCSYLPGKLQVHMAVLAALAFLWCLALSIRYELQLLQSLPATLAFLGALAGSVAILRWRVHAAARAEPDEEEVLFDDAPEPAVQTLFDIR